jgi:electron transport complex protein RnfG
MSGGAAIPAAAPISAWRMYRALVGVGLVCGMLIVTVYEATAPIILENKIAARERAVLDVLPGAVRSRTFAMADDGSVSPASAAAVGARLVFAGYDAAGALVGLAIEAQKMGYQDVVRIVYGYAPDRQVVVGIRVLDSRETPGLGDRVETDPVYQANFAALDVAVDAAGVALAHPIEVVKPGAKTADWQIDTITGATITSKAVGAMIAESAAWWIPRLRARLADFRLAEEDR